MAADENNWETDALNRQLGKQEILHRWKVFEEDQVDFMKMDIGIFLFSQVELPEGQPPPLLNEYYKLYDKSKIKTIETIVTQIRAKVPPPSKVSFGLTVLTARVKGCKETCEYVIFRFAPESLSNVFFIEPSGRVYRNWSDFVKTNKLPSCEYLAPDDGIYKLDGHIVKRTSPEAEKNFIEKHVDKAMTAVTLGIVGAGVFSVAPVTALVAGVSVGVFGTGQSVVHLRDRFRHDQSIMPNNLESISSYFTILCTGFSGVSSCAMACRQQILNGLGKYGPALLKAINIGILSLDVVGVALTCVVVCKKLDTNDLTFMDGFNLALQVYFLHGQVCNTIEIHKMFSANKNVAPPKRLTKTQKRNLQKRRAKALKRGQPLSSDTVKVTEVGEYPFDSMKLLARQFGPKCLSFLRKHFPREQLVVEFLNDMKRLISSFWQGQMTTKDFFLNLAYHLSNLIQILSNDIESLKPYAKWFKVILDANAAGIAYNGFQRVNDNEDAINEELDQMIEQTPDEGGTDSSAAAAEDDSPASNPSAADDGIIRWIDVEMILNAVKSLIGKSLVRENSAKLLVFADGVKYVQNVLVTELIGKYEKSFSATMNILNDENKAATALACVGVKSGEHFLPNRVYLEKILSKAAENVAQFVEISDCVVGVRQEEDEAADKGDDVADQISKVICELFASLVPEEKSTGLRQTLDILARVTNFYVKEKVAEFDQLRSDADELFAANIEILGPEMAHEILANVGMSVDSSQIVSNCASTKLTDTQLCRLVDRCSCVPSPEQSEGEDWENRVEGELTDRDSEYATPDGSAEDEGDFLATLTMRTSSVFMNKIGPLDCSVDDPNTLLKKVLLFVTDRLDRDTRESISTYRLLDCNVDIVGPTAYRKILQALRAYPHKNKAMLRRTSQRIMAGGDDVVLEYFEFFDRCDVEKETENVKLWQGSADEEGLQVKNPSTCSLDWSDFEYRELASSLFRVEIETDLLVEKDKHSVCLKSINYIITFSYDEESEKWLAILADNRVNQSLNEEESGCSDKN